MVGCGRASVILDNGLTVDVVTDFDNVDSLTRQCLIDDNPGRVRIIVGGAIKPSASIVVEISGEREFPYGWLARAVKALYDSQQARISYENATVWWNDGA